jgi:hypothetical protein
MDTPHQRMKGAGFRGVYVAPIAHLALGLAAYSGYVIPRLQFLGILGSILTIVDLPLSIVALILSFKNDALAVTWILVAGTCWWYFLSLAFQRLLLRVRGKTG